MSSERLQKILARAGVASRRRVEEMIKAGEVTLNGRIADLGDKADLAVDAVKVDGRRIQAPSGQHRYILLNKPIKCVSTVDDPEGRRTVMDLLPDRLCRALVPVGRLDFESEGLLLLTDDGDFAHHVAHPRYGCLKTYEVRVKGRLGDAAVERLRQGMVFEGKRTAPIKVQRYSGPSGARDSSANSWFRVGLNEGRTRQIREMFFRVGHPVQRLRRIAIGPVSDSHLPRGGWRELTNDEVEQLREKTAKRVKKPVIPKPVRRPAKATAEGDKDSAARPGQKPAGARPPARRDGDAPAGRGRGRAKGRPKGGRPESGRSGAGGRTGGPGGRSGGRTGGPGGRSGGGGRPGGASGRRSGGRTAGGPGPKGRGGRRR